MRCTRIKQHLSNPDAALTADLTGHLRECADCRREYDAELALRRSVGTVRDTQAVPRMGTAQAWVDRVVSEHEESPMSSLVRHPFSTRGRKWGWSVSAVAVALAFFVLVPLSYEHTIGTEIVIPTTATMLQQVDQSEIEVRLAERWNGSVQIAKSVETDGAMLTLKVPGTRDGALDVVHAISDLLPAPRAGQGVDLHPWTVRESGSLWAQMTGTYNVSVDVNGKSDAQIADEIRGQLETQGMQVDNLQVTTDGSGTTTLTLEGGAPGYSGEQKFEVHLNNAESGGMGQEFKTSFMVGDLPPNLTQQQKIEEIKRRLQEQGINNADVVIDGDNIKIELQEDK